jgi:hypothetical protein
MNLKDPELLGSFSFDGVSTNTGFPAKTFDNDVTASVLPLDRWSAERIAAFRCTLSTLVCNSGNIKK